MSTETGESRPPFAESQTTEAPGTVESGAPAPGGGGNGRGSRHRALRASRPRSRLRRWLLIGGGVFLVLLAAATVDAYLQAYSAVNDLRGVADGLAGARNALGRGEMPNGDPFGKALDATERIQADLAHARPTFGFVGAIPFLGRPVVAVRQLAVASEEEAKAAVGARDLIDDMSGGAFSATGGDSGQGDRTKCADEPTKEAKQACKEARDNGGSTEPGGPASPLFANGRFDLAALESFRPRVQEVVDRLHAAERAVEAVPTAPFISKATDLKRDLLAEVQQAERVGDSALRGMALLPALFGEDGPRRYFVAFGDLSYIRGAGGSTLAYAILTADDGAISISQSQQVFRNLDDQTNVPVEVPPDNWYLTGPDPLKDQIRLGNANYSPHFPSSAVVMARIYEQLTGEHLDGLIQVDAVAVADMLKATGPLEVPLWDGEINSNNAAKIAYIDSHIRYQQGPERKDLAAQMVAEAWSRIADPRDGAQLLASVIQLGNSLAGKHLQVWFADPNEQRGAEELGWAGNIEPADGDYLYLAEDSQSTDALAFFTKTTVQHQIAIQDNGDLKVRTVVKMGLNVPPIDRVRPIVSKHGDNRSTLFNLYIAAGATLDYVARDTGVAHFRVHHVLRHTEAGKQVLSALLAAPPDEPTDLIFVYTVPHGIIDVDGRRVLRLTMQVQPKVIPDELVLEVTAPEGTGFGDLPKPFVVKGRTVHLTKTADRDFSIEIPLS